MTHRFQAARAYASRFLLVAAAAFAALVVADLGLRAAGVKPHVILRWWLGCDSCAIDDNTIIIPRAFREDSFYAVDEKLPTIIALGDSFTDGFPVDQDKSYPAVLGELLKERGRPANVVNLGFGGTGPDQQLRLFISYAQPRVRPDVVVWGIYTNDIQDNVVKAAYDTDGERLVPLVTSEHWLYRRRVLFDLVPLPAETKLRSPLFRYALKAMERLRYGQAPDGSFKERERWALDKLRLEIEEMQRIAREQGFRAYFALIAPQVLYMEREGARDKAEPASSYEITNYERLHDLLADVPGFIDGYVEDGPEPRWQRLFDDGTRDEDPLGTRHFNEAGYAAFAGLIARRLTHDVAQGEWKVTR